MTIHQHELRQLATDHDMHKRLAATLNQPDVDDAVVQAVILQLVGAPSQSQSLGKDIRGDIHLGVISDIAGNLSHFLSAVLDLAPINTAHLNGTKTSFAGVIGHVSGGNLSSGPVLNSKVDLTVIEQFDSIDANTQKAFQQIIDVGTYSFAKSNYRDSVSTSGSILIGLNSWNEEFKHLEPLDPQIELRPALASGLDLVITGNLNNADTIEISEKPIEEDLARQYIVHARNIKPTLSEETENEIRTYLDRNKDPVKDRTECPLSQSKTRLRRTLSRFALAHARLRLSDQTRCLDAKRAITLVEMNSPSLSVNHQQNQPKEEKNEAGKQDPIGEEIKDLKTLISKIEEEYKEGAPFDVVLERAQEIGMVPYKTALEIEKLKNEGEIYEPKSSCIRVS
jgi:replicative DNA helicase Mcm